jgi:hypothetical protein
MAHFPPGESLAIAGVMRLTGVQPVVAALWILALSAGLTLALAFLVSHSVAGWAAGILSVILLAAMPPFLRVHTAIWSEPLYLPFLLLTLWLMMARRSRPLAGGMIALASASVRYLGLANAVALGVWALLRGWKWKKGALAVLPVAVGFTGWWLWTKTQGSAVRTVGEFQVGLGDTLAQLRPSLEFWLAPGYPLPVSAVLLVGVLAAFLLGPRRLGQPVGVLMGAHLGVIVLSRLVLDQRIPFDVRILLPILVLAVLQVGATLGRRPKWALLALPWILLVGREDVRGIRSLYRTGQFYSSTEWLTSDLVSWAKNESHPYRIYSNEPGLIVLLAGRPAKLLPLKTQDLDAFLAAWTDRPGAIVLAAPLRPDEWPPEVYPERLPLRVVIADQRSVVFLPDSSASEGGG